MLPIHPSNARLWSMLGSRGTFGVAMLDAAANVADVMVLTADLVLLRAWSDFASRTRTNFSTSALPNRI